MGDTETEEKQAIRTRLQRLAQKTGLPLKPTDLKDAEDFSLETVVTYGCVGSAATDAGIKYINPTQDPAPLTAGVDNENSDWMIDLQMTLAALADAIDRELILVVVDADGEPVEGASLSMVGPDHRAFERMDEDGIVRVTPENAGEYAIGMTHWTARRGPVPYSMMRSLSRKNSKSRPARAMRAIDTIDSVTDAQ